MYKKWLLYLFFFFVFFVIIRCQCGNFQLMWKEEESIFCQKVDVAKNKNLEDVTEEQLQAEARFIVQHPGFEETDEGWLRPLHLFRYRTSLNSASLVFVFFFLNPVVFCSYCNVNTARGSTVLDNLSLNIYIYIFFFFFFFFTSMLGSGWHTYEKKRRFDPSSLSVPETAVEIHWKSCRPI